MIGNRIALLFVLITIGACANAKDAKNPVNDLQPQSEVLYIGGAEIELVYNQAGDVKADNRWVDWVSRSAHTVSEYYGQFPIKKAAVNLVMNPGLGVKTGRAYQGVDKPQIIIWVGRDTSESELERDWIMVHEMIHLATASLPRQHHWLEEGLSVYIESVARAQSGELPVEKVWREFYRRMPNGQPITGDRGLDNTPTWGRTYWGGAIFCLLVDVAVRQHTDNQMSLRDVVRSVVRENLTMNRNASMDAILQAMDKPFDQPLVRRIYEKYADTPKPFELEKMWQELGVSLVNGKAIFNDGARLAYIRRAITKQS